MIQLLVADPWPLFRQGMRALIGEVRGIAVVAEAGNCSQLYDVLRTQQRLDVALVDLDISGTSSIEPLRHALAMRPALPILVLSSKGHLEYAVRALKAGAAGYATKDSTTQSLIDAIRRLALGGQYLSSHVAEQVALQWRRGDTGAAPHSVLSTREFSVFEMLAQGCSGAQIASALSLSRKTVSTHKTRVLRKMNVTNLADLVRYAIEHQFVPGQRTVNFRGILAD
ncbi:MAG: DNA-binding response regulator [Proteobacteria bacterium]|jgi:DNA-binding NarL/FixJ family response regulator|nr:DNA-binding response regulator [Pseudomonadota bacterium]